MDLKSTDDENVTNFENKKATTTANISSSRGETPTVLTSFSEALNEKNNFDEGEMKDVQLYEEKNSLNEKLSDDNNDEIAKEEKIEDTGQKEVNDEEATLENHFKFESLSQLKNCNVGKTVVLHSSNETPQETFSRLKEACIEGTLTYEDITDGLFNTLVGGPFDIESKYMLNNCESVKLMLELTDLCPPKIQAEIWSIFVAIVKKSFLNLEICSKAGLVSLLLDRLPEADFIIADLFIQLLTVLTEYSISVKEFKHFLKSLKAVNNSWKRNSIKLLNVMAEMPKREGPDVFFSFPGKASAGIFIPPLIRWPHQNGWTFCTWFRMDPLNSVYFEREKPFLFNFSTSKGNGYFCYFMGSCLVLRCIRAPGKEIMRCIKLEFLPRKWYHIALTFIYSRWSKGEIHCFIDGCLVEVIDANWLVSQNEHFDHCYIGCGQEPNEGEAFSGQMAAIYVLSQSISPQQAACLHYLGSCYQSHFKHKTESNLPENYKKMLFDGKLNESIVFSYCPKDCHGQMVLSQSSVQNISKSSTNVYFVQVPHAIMKNGVEVITTHSIHNSLHSLGGIQMLLPLFSQIDMAKDELIEEELSSKLLTVIATLLATSLTAQQQFLQCKGFCIISNLLQNSSNIHLSINLLETFISMSKAFLNFNNGLALLKQLVENIFLASHLWLKSEPLVQVRLYTFLANEFFCNTDLLQIVRRTQTVVILMNTLKKYWIILPNNNNEEIKELEEEVEELKLNKFERSSIVHIRTCILKLVYNFTFLSNQGSDERDEELQCIFNFIATTNEDDNLYDVLTQTMQQISDHPAILVPVFDKKKVICIIFNLISSPNELIKIPALKMFGYYLCRSTQKRKNESINQKNLFALLTDKLLINSSSKLSLAIYNSLFEILVEFVCPEILFVKHEDLSIENTRFENPQILKVIAQLLCLKDGEEGGGEGGGEEELNNLKIKKIFLQDLIRYCKDCRENRRIILQMSVWQEWLISLCYIFPQNEEQKIVSQLCFQLFSILLFHAIRLEYGGWRVWVDTMAIAHSKVSWKKYCKNLTEKNLNKKNKLNNNNLINNNNEQGGGGGEISSVLYRTPDFVWSEIQIHFLNDLLMLIQSVVQEWKESPNSISEHLNNSENHVFITNTVHIFSQLSDSLVMACGGLLPLLAAATAPTSELELFDTTQQELNICDAAYFLDIFAEIADVFIFASPLTLSELEQEKNMPAGGILRQALRLAATSAVRGILTNILSNNKFIFGSESTNNSSKFETIKKFIKDKSTTNNENIKEDQLLQTLDLQRLKNLIYRDMEEIKQAQFLALSIVYFLSVLMVSRYRDILEPNTVNNNCGNLKKEINEKKLNEKQNSERFKVEEINAEEKNLKNNNKSLKNNEKNAEDEEKEEENYLNKSRQEEEENEEEEDEEEENNNNELTKGISSIKLQQKNLNETNNKEQNGRIDENNSEVYTNKYEPHHLTSLNHSDFIPSSSSSSSENSVERRRYLTDKLQNSLEPVIPLFREILCDFRSFLQKTLLGTHGQEIMNDVKVMHTLKNGSVIEIVMLLCSQEWQTSLQKHSGLAFIELVNEGRLMAHATRDHILRVANEADFILNRLRAEDVSKHTQFESEVNEQLQHRKTEEQLSNQLIISARRREFIQSNKFLEKITNILTSPTGAWYIEDLQKNIPKFEKLDVWEDDSRMRRRFVYNPHGRLLHSISNETIKNVEENNKNKKDEDLNKLLKDLARKMMASGSVSKTNNILQQFVDEAEIERLIREENNNNNNNDINSSETKNGLSTYSTFAKLIAPGVIVPGTITLTGCDLYFDADEDDQIFKQNLQSLKYCDNLHHSKWNFQEIRAIFLRRFLLQYTALELFLDSRTAIMFAFRDFETVQHIVNLLPPVGVGVKYGLPQNRKSSLMTPWQLFKHSNMPQKWQQREISNFDYLMFLNTIAGRTYNDLNQYPVFPWILSNYSSETIDLNDASNFRDLSKPIGALSENRKKQFKERYNNWDDIEIPPFHYGTHYSCSSFVLNWLFRIEPFYTFYNELLLNNSSININSNRLFYSIEECWEHCLNDLNDVKELIPELFYLSEMFLINNNLNNYGIREDGNLVANVILPLWANNNCEQFIKIHRQALESDLVSCQLNQWIDLIFGYKQRGTEAIRSLNTFYYLTYEGTFNLRSIDNAALKESIQQQILNFGQTPAQLLNEPHPPRHSIMTMSPLIFKTCPNDLCMIMKFISNSPVVHITANTFQQIENPTLITIAQNLVFALNRWNINYNQSQHQKQQQQSQQQQQSSTSSTTLVSSFENENINNSSNNQTDVLPSELPITVDPLLAVGNPSQKLPKRHLGDSFDQKLSITWANFVCSVDSKYIIACGYTDYSFRIIETENAQVRQVIYGHGDVVTCLARSEITLFSDCYIASGSADCTVVLWHFNHFNGTIAGEFNSLGELPSPKAILTGHESVITAITISAEHGLVISGSKDGTLLIHTTMGDFLRNIEINTNPTTINQILLNRDCQIAIFHGSQQKLISTATVNGKFISQIEMPEGILCSVLSKDGEFFVVGTENGKILILRFFPLQLVYTYAQTDSSIKSIAISTNQKLIFGGLDSGAIVVFNVDFNRFDFSRMQQTQQRKKL